MVLLRPESKTVKATEGRKGSLDNGKSCGTSIRNGTPFTHSPVGSIARNASRLEPSTNAAGLIVKWGWNVLWLATSFLFT